MSKYQVEVERWQVLGALAFVKKISAPGAFLIGKLTIQIENFLNRFPNAEKFRLTAEAVEAPKTEPKTQNQNDREAEEEQADPSENHYR